MAYSLETVIAEKMHAIIDLADQSSRMKDYYDLYNILSKETYDKDILQDAIEHTFENRHTAYDTNTMFFRKEFSDNPQMQVRGRLSCVKLPKLGMFHSKMLLHTYKKLCVLIGISLHKKSLLRN